MKNDYIFLSYSHVDKDAINMIANKIKNDGYRVWYDNGINPGSEWSEDIAIHIEKAKVFVAFITKDYIKSENCKDELSYARENSLIIILVFLKEVEIPSGMKLRNHRRQQLFYYQYSDKQEFYNKLYIAEGIENCSIDSIDKKNDISMEDTDNKKIDIESLRISSQAGNAESTYRLAKCVETGNSVDMDKMKAFELYELARKQGSLEAITELGRLYKYGLGCRVNKKKAFKYYIEAAEKGEGKALDLIADAYEYGEGVRKSKKKAWKFRTKAYEVGYRIVAGELGEGYQKGIFNVVKRDIRKAIEYYEIAISLGKTLYVGSLVNIYLTCGEEFDPEKAEKLLLAYPDEEVIGDNWYLLGMCYFKGSGIEQDKIKGIEYLKKSADIGIDARAANELGRIFQEGDGVYKNTDLAEEYYEQASDATFSFLEPCVFLKSKNGRKKILKVIGIFLLIVYLGFSVGRELSYVQPLHLLTRKIKSSYESSADSQKYITKTFSNMKIKVSEDWEEIINNYDEENIDVDYYFHGQNEWDSMSIYVTPYDIGTDNTDYLDYNAILKKFEEENITKIMLLSGEKGYYIDNITKYDGVKRFTRIYLFIHKNELYQIMCLTTNPPEENFLKICQSLEDSISFGE